MIARSVIRAARTIRAPPAFIGRSLSTGQSTLDDTALTAASKSCYQKIDWKISEEATVFECVQRMAAHRIGALAVTASSGSKVIGIVSERDYLSKVALLGKSSKSTKVAEIATMGDTNLVTVTEDEPVDDCMKKLLARDCRHLLVRDKTGDITGLVSIKDLCKCVVARHTEVVERLVNFNTGKGAFFGSE